MVAKYNYRSIYENRYSVPNLDFFVCAYCGDTQEVFDHVPPIHLVSAFPAKDFGTYWLVPCCKKCNASLGGHSMLVTFEQRKAYIRERISPGRNTGIVGR